MQGEGVTDKSTALWLKKESIALREIWRRVINFCRMIRRKIRVTYLTQNIEARSFNVN